jgi:hypothetical protein
LLRLIGDFCILEDDVDQPSSLLNTSQLAAWLGVSTRPCAYGPNVQSCRPSGSAVNGVSSAKQSNNG